MRAGAMALALTLAACGASPIAPDVRAPEPAPPPACPIGGCVTADAARSGPPPTLACSTSDECDALAKKECADGSNGGRCTARAFDLWGKDSRATALLHVVALFARGCDLGDARGCHYAGRMFLDGKGVAKDVDRGVKLLDAACDEDHEQSCVVLASRYGTSTTPDATRYSLKLACVRGNGGACTSLGGTYERAHPRDSVRAARAYERGCNLGQATACERVGWILANGDGVPKDGVKGLSLIEHACERGDAVACVRAGVLVEFGEVGTADATRAGTLYAKACGQGSPYGCLHDDMRDEYKRGVPHDPAHARAKWEADCAAGRPAACGYAAVTIADARTGTYDETRALELLRKACHGNQPRACEWLRQRDQH